MQKDVKVFNPKMLSDIFPALEIKVNTWTGVSKVHVGVLNGEDLLKLVTIYLECAIDLFVSRYDKGITIEITPHPEGYTSDKPRVLKIIPLEIA